MLAGDVTTKRVDEGRPTRSNASFRLVVVDGPDKGRSFDVPASTASRVILGTSAACTIRLADPHVSRRHATLELQGPRLELTDLGSRNGTFANEVGVTQAHLWGGERLRLGSTEMRVELDDGVVVTPLSVASRFGRLLGGSPQMRQMYETLRQIAESVLPVLVEGETGTGKELLAEALHEGGPRREGPFVVFDGDERTFAAAHGGTILLDEVAELDAPTQKKLLRLLERTDLDVRVIATTQVDLDARVQEGTLREDLYYRLAVLRVELPALRKRQGDVSMLAKQFWTDLGGVGAPPSVLLDQLEKHAWPGNVRELKNRIARALTEAPVTACPEMPAGRLDRHDDDEDARGRFFGTVLDRDLPLPRARAMVVAEFEREYVARVLATHAGNVSRAAAASGLARRYFQVLRAKRALPDEGSPE